MSKRKLEKDEIKEIAHFLTKRSIKTETGRPITALTEYLDTYNQFIDRLEEYNSTC